MLKALRASIPARQRRRGTGRGPLLNPLANSGSRSPRSRHQEGRGPPENAPGARTVSARHAYRSIDTTSKSDANRRAGANDEASPLKKQLNGLAVATDCLLRAVACSKATAPAFEILIDLAARHQRVLSGAAPRDCAATRLADAETGEVDEYLEGWGRRLRARNRSEKTIRGYGETVQLFLQQRGLVIRSGSSIGVRFGRVVSIDRYACRALTVLAPGAFSGGLRPS